MTNGSSAASEKVARQHAVTRRVALRVFISLVAINAAIAIGVLIAGGSNDTTGRILGTSLTLTGGVLLTLACSTAIGAPRLGMLGAAGVAATLAATALLVVGIWTVPDESWFWKLTGSLFACSLAVGLVGLIRLPRLRRAQWLQASVVGLTGVLLAVLIAGIWTEPDQEWFWRAFGAIAVCLAGLVLIVPVLHRVDSRDVHTTGLGPGSVNYCPHCGQPLVTSLGAQTTCPRCRSGFTVYPVLAEGLPNKAA